MNSKWYISTFIIIIAFIGLNQEHAQVPNQEITLRFTDVEMTSATAYDDALAAVAEKLEAFGIVDISVVENNEGQLSIRYYSDIDAQSVGEFLSQDSALSLAFTELEHLPLDFPEDKLPESFSIVVSDLQQQNDHGLGLNGKLAFELNQDYKWFTNPVVIPASGIITLGEDAIVQLAYKINRNIAIAIDTTSDTIPEVRAGPSFIYGNSLSS